MQVAMEQKLHQRGRINSKCQTSGTAAVRQHR